jgi:hypothetical protein
MGQYLHHPHAAAAVYGAAAAAGFGGSTWGGGQQLSASEQLKEASDRLRRLQATAAGPPALRDAVTVSTSAAC